MRKLVLTCLATGLFIGSAMAQTLFTYGNNPVSKEEFLRIYQKNSLNKKPDFSEPALREYLDLYSLFRMKVKEAENQKMDTILSIQRELDNYRKQLAKNYLTDEQVNNRLLKEAYERMKEDRHVAHILLLAPAAMSPEDTARVYARIDSIYKAIVTKKADFGDMARQYSEDKGSKDNGGDIGFMTALQTLYPFENAAYETAPGKVSAPFRTQLGYHIVKVIETRPARGEVQVAQIMVATSKAGGEASIAHAKKKIDSVENDLKKGMSFEDAVKKYSEDKFTINDGGLMQPFPVGRMTPAFENAAFALKNPGDISAPVQTDYGFHILKLVKKTPVKPYDTIYPQLKRLVENDSRAQMARDIYFERIKQKNGFKEYPANLNELVNQVTKIPDTGKTANTFHASDFASMNKPVFSLGQNNYTQSDLMSFAESLTRGRLMGPKSNMMHDIYKMYVSKVVNDFQENKLVEENADFRNLMEEYKDGIMLFELMDENVWGKASKDSAGLEAFYQSHKDKYQWEPGFSGSIYRFKDETAMKQGMAVLSKKNMTDEDVLKELNTESNPDAVTIQTGRYEFSHFKDIPRQSLVKGKVSNSVKNTDGSYTAVRVDEIYETPTQKSLSDARGYVVAEYQDYLEKQWNDQLRRKYPLKVEEPVFKSMVK